MTCKDCVHYDLCRSCSRIQLGWHGNSVHYVENIKEICTDFKARSRFVELPCNMGDTVYIALNGYGVLKDTVKEFRITSRRIWIIPEKFGMDCLLENMAFLTSEAAEKALKEREA